jgi:superfamily II DNA helicase RecQ
MKSSHTVQGVNKEIFSAKNCLSFLVCLHVAIINSLYSNIVLKPKQVFTLEKIFMGKDVLGALPTGYGNSLIFHLLPVLLF